MAHLQVVSSTRSHGRWRGIRRHRRSLWGHGEGLARFLRPYTVLEGSFGEHRVVVGVKDEELLLVVVPAGSDSTPRQRRCR
jgi:hypothetical protein